VSKGWHGLISDQAFLAAHKLRHIDPLLVDTGFFRGNKKRDLRLMDMDGNIVRVFEGIGGSGMFPTTSLDNLISVWDGSCEDVHHEHESCKTIHVVDPATGEVLFTSPGHEVIEDDAFTEYYKIFSIGRATPSGVYKVVRLVGGNICDVITLGDDTGWRRKTWPRPVPKYRLDRGCSPVTIDGVMYFLIKGTSDVTLVCFDLESERWKDDTIEGPQTVSGAETWSRSEISVYIIELNGSLCMVQEECIDGHLVHFQHPQAACSNVWILDDFEKSNWTKLCTIPIGPLGRSCMPLRMMQNGEKLLVQCGTTYKRSSLALQVYDLRTEKFSNITGKPGYLPCNIALCNLHLEQLVLARN
jgi:F-box interacting protein